MVAQMLMLTWIDIWRDVPALHFWILFFGFNWIGCGLLAILMMGCHTLWSQLR